MTVFRRVAFSLAALLCVAVVVPGAAQAALSAGVVVQPDGAGSRLVVTVSTDKPLSAKKKPTKVVLTSKGKTFKLTKLKGTTADVTVVGTWRSAVLTGKSQTAAQALVGKKVSVVVTSKSGAKTVKATPIVPPTTGGGTAPGGVTNPGTTTPVPAGNTTPLPMVEPLFGAPPATKQEGQAALNGIQKYLADSRITDCVAGWPNCAGGIEHRYSVFGNGDFYHCRLTMSSGSDIRSYGSSVSPIGAEWNTDGSWAVTYVLLSYGNYVYYSWFVAANGTASGLYWPPGTTPQANQPSEQFTGYQWVRGAKDCSY